jgi:hypothetical protein
MPSVAESQLAEACLTLGGPPSPPAVLVLAQLAPARTERSARSSSARRIGRTVSRFRGRARGRVGQRRRSAGPASVRLSSLGWRSSYHGVPGMSVKPAGLAVSLPAAPPLGRSPIRNQEGS